MGRASYFLGLGNRTIHFFGFCLKPCFPPCFWKFNNSWIHKFSCFSMFSIAFSHTVGITLLLYRMSSSTNRQTLSSSLYVLCSTYNTEFTARGIRTQTWRRLIYSMNFLHNAHTSPLCLGTLYSSSSLCITAVWNRELTLNINNWQNVTLWVSAMKQQDRVFPLRPQRGSCVLWNSCFLTLCT
jgi:hypothetical protein